MGTKIIRKYELTIEIEVTDALEAEYTSTYQIRTIPDDWSAEGTVVESFFDDTLSELSDALCDQWNEIFEEALNTDES